MSEILYYNAGLKEAFDDLAKALKVKGNILIDSEMTDLKTLGMGHMGRDVYATGISGRYNGISWTVRWDWDPNKQEHINVQCGDQWKAAYMSQPKHAYQAHQNIPENLRPQQYPPLFIKTLEKATTDAEWKLEVWKSKSYDRQAYRQQCARELRGIWYQRMYNNWR